VESALQCLYVGYNNNSFANCIFYRTKKSNQPEDGS